ncbi:MAG: phosphotransferase [Bacteroidales bacterium]|nr:phosphotransferase [Bacteroidales bacterium]
MKNQVLKLQGRSGCTLEIIDGSQGIVLRKYAGTVSYNLRLENQIKKQINFFNNLPLSEYFNAPAVFQYSKGSDRQLAWFDMEYIYGEKYNEYFEKCTVQQLNRNLEIFLEYFSRSLDLSVPKKTDPEVFLQKTKQIREAVSEDILKDPVFSTTLTYLEQNVPDGYLPRNPCHGDFTFSNMIFSNNNIYLLDFLDSFIDSPLIDLVKLRQDTKFYWTLFIDKTIQNHQATKIIQILNYFDRQIQQYFMNNSYIQGWYDYLEKLNLIRILPYLKTKNEIMFVMDCLKR